MSASPLATTARTVLRRSVVARAIPSRVVRAEASVARVRVVRSDECGGGGGAGGGGARGAGARSWSQSWAGILGGVGVGGGVLGMVMTTGLSEARGSGLSGEVGYESSAAELEVYVSSLASTGMSASSTVTETKSGVTFPTRLPMSTQVLVGASVRLMRQLVQVYALGVYVDDGEGRLRKRLAKWQTFATADLIGNAQGLWETLCHPDTPKTMRLVVVRPVSGKHMGDGFRRALAPRVTQYASQHGGMSPKDVKRHMDEFCAAFKKVGLMKQGSVADMSVSTDGDGNNVVKLVIDERCVAVIKDRALAWALSDMYLGESSVVSGMREQVAIGLEQMLRN